MLELVFALFWAAASTVLGFHWRGPTLPSWSLRYALAVALTRCMLDLKRRHTVARIRRLEILHDRVIGPPGGVRLPDHGDQDIAVSRIEWTIDVKSLLEPERVARKRAGGVCQGYFVPEEVEYDLATEREILPRKHALQCHLTAEWTYHTDVMDNQGTHFDGKPRKVVLVAHGGAFAFCTAPMYRSFAERLARASGADVLVVEYRKPPEFPFPAAIHDVFAAYLALVDPTNPAFYATTISPVASPKLPRYAPNNVTIFGDSAGANLALATCVYLSSFLPTPLGTPTYPIPGSLVLHSGWFDLTHSAPSWDEFGWVDTIPKTIVGSMLGRIYNGAVNCAWAYVNGFGEGARPCRVSPAQDPKSDGSGDDWRTRTPDRFSALPGRKSRTLPRTSGLSSPLSPSSPAQPTRLSAELTLLSLLMHPLISSARTADLSSLPPLLLQSASHECMRDDSLLLLERWSGSARHEVYDETCHDFVLSEGFAQSERSMSRIAKFINGDLPRSIERLRVRPDGLVERGKEERYNDRLHEFVSRLCLVNREAGRVRGVDQ